MTQTEYDSMKHGDLVKVVKSRKVYRVSVLQGRRWLCNTQPVASLIGNLREVFKAGYVLGRRDAETT